MQASIKRRELYEGGDTMAKVLPQLLSKNPRFIGCSIRACSTEPWQRQAVRTAGTIIWPSMRVRRNT